MRSLMVIAISLSMLIPGAFAQSNCSSTTPSGRAAAAKRETKDLEKARLIDALRHLRMQAPSEEGQQLETPAPTQSLTPESTEQQHPEWFRETNRYKPCPWNMCPSPPQ